MDWATLAPLERLKDRPNLYMPNKPFEILIYNVDERRRQTDEEAFTDARREYAADQIVRHVSEGNIIRYVMS